MFTNTQNIWLCRIVTVDCGLLNIYINEKMYIQYQKLLGNIFVSDIWFSSQQNSLFSCFLLVSSTIYLFLNSSPIFCEFLFFAFFACFLLNPPFFMGSHHHHKPFFFFQIPPVLWLFIFEIIYPSKLWQVRTMKTRVINAS